MSLEHFWVNRYRLTLTAREPIVLPVYKGTTLRGGFAFTFRRLVCYQLEVPNCDDCLLRFTCPYTRLFDTFPPPNAEVLSNLKDVPSPLVIEPPQDNRRQYSPGDELIFHLVLIGNAQTFLPYLALAFQELGRRGLGKKHGRFTLTEIEAVHPYTNQKELIYSQERPSVIRPISLPVPFAECEVQANHLSADTLTFHFLTPTRLREEGHTIQEPPDFHVIWRALMRRVSSLAYFHCGQKWEADYRALAEASRQIQCVEKDMHWKVYHRFSTRQERNISISGLVGTVTYAGDLSPFLPVLRLGELVHVGKATVLGNGRYYLRNS